MTPSSAKAAGVSVKPLEWCEIILNPNLRGGSHCYAGSILGTYKVWGDGSWTIDAPGAKFIAGRSTIDAAKALAQADYAARIMSALSISDGEGAVAWRVLEEIEHVANGRDNLDGFPRSKDEKQRRLSKIYELAAEARINRPTHPAPVAAQPAEGWAATMRAIPDEAIRHIAEAKDVASCRARIAAALSALPAQGEPK